MDAYRALAQELMLSMNRKHRRPPHEEVSAAMRGEMAVLRLLEESGESLTAGEISRELQMKTSRIAAVLGSLEKKEMILRRSDDCDRRRVQVVLTQKGRAFCQRRRQEALKDMTALFARLGEEDAAHFVRIMKRIHEFMPAHPPCMQDEQTEKEETAE